MRRMTSIPFARVGARYPESLRAYLTGDPRLAPRYAVYPSTEAGLAAHAARIPEPPRRAELAARLVEYNRALEASPAALRAAESLSRPGALAVVTGQQPGLLGGPLFTAYKAASAVALARRLRGRLGRPVVAVFWNHSDDHDLDEVGRAHWFDRHGGLRKALALGAERGFAVADLADPEPFEQAVREVLADLSARDDAGHESDASRSVRKAALVGKPHAEAFSRLFARLFQEPEDPLVLFEPRLARDLLRPVFARELETRPHPCAGVVARGAEAWSALGFEPPLRPDARPDLFLRTDRGRSRLLPDGDGFRVALTDARLSRAGALALVEDTPERLSAGVALRIACQEYLFPTIAQVVGPNELAYLGQLRGLHEAFGLVPPVLVPRATATLVEPGVARAAAKLGVGEGYLLVPEAWRDAAKARRQPAELEAACSRFRADVADSLARLFRSVRETEAPAAGGGTGEAPDRGCRSDANRLVRAGRELERRLREQWLEAEGIGARRVERSLAHLLPGGELQERVLGCLPYVARHGAGFLADLAAAWDPFAPEHYLLFPA